eukprot:3921865-Prymnesium_polylepis.1
MTPRTKRRGCDRSALASPVNVMHCSRLFSVSLMNRSPVGITAMWLGLSNCPGSLPVLPNTRTCCSLTGCTCDVACTAAVGAGSLIRLSFLLDFLRAGLDGDPCDKLLVFSVKNLRTLPAFQIDGGGSSGASISVFASMTVRSGGACGIISRTRIIWLSQDEWRDLR